MKTTHARMILSATIGAAAVLTLTGCTVDQPQASKWQDPFFPTEGRKSSVDLMLDHVTAIGCAEDATLYGIHFDGDELNALGEQKLAAVAKGRKRNVPLTIYVDAPKEASRNDRRVAMVQQVLSDLGAYGSDGKVVVGPNPNAGGPAGPAIKVLNGEAAGPAVAADAGPAMSAGN